MTSSDLSKIMSRHGMLQRDLALMTGRTERAVFDWVHGRRILPKAVVLLLLALDEGRIDAQWLISKLK